MSNSERPKYITLFICLLLIICVISVCSYEFTQKTSNSNDEVDNFVEVNHANLDISNNTCNSGFNIMDSDSDKNNVILAGEGHAVAINYGLELALLKHLNQKDKVRYLLAEIGFSSSCYINEYLESGDETKLKLIYNDLVRTASWSKESYNFWIELRKYNLTIPKDQRIKVIGIDIEHQVKTACDYLNSILPPTAPPKVIKLSIEKYTDNFKSKDNNNMLATIKSLQNDIKIKPSIYKAYLGSNYFNFTIVLDNIVNSINAYASNRANFDDIREPIIYSNFKRIYSHFPIGKYFGEFGMEHVYQKNCSSYLGNKTRFAMYLNSNDSPVKGRVMSIAYGYENCTYMTSGHNYGESIADPIISDIDILDRFSKTNITVFKLNGANSPFSSKTYFVEGSNGGCTTNYFQYIILIKNSKGTIPLGKL